MPEYGVGATPANEILLEGGNLEYSTTVTGEVSAGTWSGVGYTAKDAGAEVSIGQATFREVKATGLQDPVKRRGLDREITLKATLLQANLNNLALACGGTPADVVGGVYKGGKAVQGTLLKWRHTVQNEDDNTKDLRVYFMLGRVSDAVSIPFGDEKETAFLITIKAEAVDTADAITWGGATMDGERFVMQEGSY